MDDSDLDSREPVSATGRSTVAMEPESWPMVSVIVPIYNGEADLPPLVDCLLAQDYPPSQVEFILVDNRSGDRSWDWLQRAQQMASDRGWQLHPLQELTIQSSYAARNRGIRVARGEILVFTDADCRPRPQWLRSLIGDFADPAIGMVAGEITSLPGHTLLERYADRQETLSQKHTIDHPFLPYGQTANLAVRREVFQAIGLFRPYLTTGGDADLCWRMQQATDWVIAFAPGAIVEHRHRATWQEFASQWRRYGRSNRYLHQLHGVPLMRRRSARQELRRWVRWSLRELPLAFGRWLFKRGSLLDALSTPIELLGSRERWRGQVRAQLPDRADWIEPFEELK